MTKTRSMLQIPAANPKACLLGVQFRDAIEESPFLMRVGEFIRQLFSLAINIIVINVIIFSWI